jgi:hypothetical protein
MVEVPAGTGHVLLGCIRRLQDVVHLAGHALATSCQTQAAAALDTATAALLLQGGALLVQLSWVLHA